MRYIRSTLIKAGLGIGKSSGSRSYGSKAVLKLGHRRVDFLC